MTYPFRIVKFTITATLLNLFMLLSDESTFDDFSLYEVILVCKLCKEHLKKPQIQPQCYLIKMVAPATVPEILSLTDAKARMVSQVKPFMKIHSLTHKGQHAMKGTCIHFPQCVDEVAEIQPRKCKDADILIECKSGEDSIPEELVVNFKKLHVALHYLGINNPLYRKVRIDPIVDETDNFLRIIQAVPSNTIDEQALEQNKYFSLSSGFETLDLKRAATMYQYAGSRDKMKNSGHVYTRMKQSLEEFIESEYSSCILTVNHYSMAIIKEGMHVYLFDSHARGRKGIRTTGRKAKENGKAFVMKIATEAAPSAISYIIYWKCQASTYTSKNEGCFIYCLTVMSHQILFEDNDAISDMESEMRTDSSDSENQENENCSVSMMGSATRLLNS
ncbi:unnamed protein product [Orchesella dallaii]|uniref:Uncharacterized protein n=1 Tax=Orchesella dallaii TaxID=48710 RepID=A0ABP1R4U8_9HEXA